MTNIEFRCESFKLVNPVIFRAAASSFNCPTNALRIMHFGLKVNF